MSVLKGPADADHYRVQVGRFGDRWYADPLPACEIAPTTDASWPSVSTIKKASGSDWSTVSLNRVAVAVAEKPDTFAGLQLDEIKERMRSINKIGLNRAGQRGTNVHSLCEAKLLDRVAMVGPNDPGYEYRGAVDAFFDDYQPELVATEVVCIDRGLNGAGYGGTCDAFMRIAGKTYIVDWKSRGVDSNHGAYPEEGAQEAAYACAEYMIVQGANGPQRIRVPELTGGLIISIKPDGYRVYPIDLDDARAHWVALHSWWVARRDERKAVGKPWAPRTTNKIEGGSVGQGGSSEPRSADASRSESMPAPGHPEPPPFDAPIAVAAPPAPEAPKWLETITAPAEGPTMPREMPDEGDDLSDDHSFDAIEAAYSKLSKDDRAWMGALVSEAMRNNVSFHAKDHKTLRRFEILRGLVNICEAGGIDDDSLRALVSLAMGSDAPLFGSVALGHAVGAMNADEARQFAQHVETYVAGSFVAEVSLDGLTRLRAA